MRRTMLAGLTLALLAVPAMAAPALTLNDVDSSDDYITMSPAQFGEIFCITRLGNDMAPIEAVLTADLTSAIDEAWAKDDAWEAQNPDEKPPLGDGIPWQSWQDYADQCTVGDIETSDGEARVEIDYAFSSDASANFTDTLILKQVEDGESGARLWRLDNIVYGTEGDLRTVLVTAFED